MFIRRISGIQQKLCPRHRQQPILSCMAHTFRTHSNATHSDVKHDVIDHTIEDLVRQIHSCRTKAAVFVTGGGSQGVSWLLSVPGASATVTEVVVPYSRNSLLQLLGKEPDQYCSPETALSLAKAGYQRAAALTNFGTHIVGLGATCALASEPPKRGNHRAYVAAHSSSGARLLSIKLAKGSRSRWGEEQLVGQLLVKVLAEACDIDTSSLQLPLISNTAAPAGAAADTPTAAQAAPLHDELHTQMLPAAEPLQDLIDGKVQCVEYSGGHVFVDAPRSAGKVYLPGSFNPLHEGHQGMLETAVQIAAASGDGADGETEGCFELAAVNADKGHLEVADIQRRVAQFTAAGVPVLVTAAPLLVDKARLLPGAKFVLGWDTAVRIVMPKYYGNTEIGLQLTFADIRHQGCRFLVAGRLDDKGDGSFKTLKDINLPPEVADLFEQIPESVFRSDVSSTALRAQGLGLK